jgi:hypothetical protein
MEVFQKCFSYFLGDLLFRDVILPAGAEKTPPCLPVSPVKDLDGKELATKYMRGYVWTNILGTSYLFNRVKCEAYCLLLKPVLCTGLHKET